LVSPAINHVTAASASFEALLSIAAAGGCQGVELRNDLQSPLFDGRSAAQAGAMASEHGLQIYALAEVVAFNHFDDTTRTAAQQLAALASECGARGIVLIPANDGSNPAPAERRAQLKTALVELQPILEPAGLVGFIEPLGFATSTIRYKAEVVDVIEGMNAADQFKLVHDTFHHHLAGDTECFVEHTGIVHVSGVTDDSLDPSQMQDHHRELVNGHDQLATLAQLQVFSKQNYRGPVSMEAFAPHVHVLPNLAAQLQDSFRFINSGLAAAVA
jgi:2-keto-myo-inositol isomerase